MTIWEVLILALCLSLAISGFAAFAGLGDVPEDRSNHKRVTPTGGGLGIIAALGGASLVWGASGLLSREFGQILSLIWAVGFLGFSDDIFDISAKFKFLMLAVCAAAAVWVIGPVTKIPFGLTVYELPYWAGFIGSFLWLFTVTNIINFMDGSNGLMLIVMSIATGALAVIGLNSGGNESILLCLILLAGMAGLMPYNVRPEAKIFTGDVGSLTVGFAFAVAVLWFCREGADIVPVYIGPLLILPFLTDGLLTMQMRVRSGERLMTAHRRHLYQRMITAGFSHMNVALIYGIISLVIAIFAVWAAGRGVHQFISFLILPVLASSLIWVWAGRKFS